MVKVKIPGVDSDELYMHNVWYTYKILWASGSDPVSISHSHRVCIALHNGSRTEYTTDKVGKVWSRLFVRVRQRRRRPMETLVKARPLRTNKSSELLWRNIGYTHTMYILTTGACLSDIKIQITRNFAEH